MKQRAFNDVNGDNLKVSLVTLNLVTSERRRRHQQALVRRFLAGGLRESRKLGSCTREWRADFVHSTV